MRTEIVVVNKVQQTTLVSLDEETAERRDRLVAEGKCLGCGKYAEGGARGACGKCYAATRRAIARGQTSEVDLVRLGLLLPVGIGGRRKTNPMAKRIDGEQ